MSCCGKSRRALAGPVPAAVPAPKTAAVPAVSRPLSGTGAKATLAYMGKLAIQLIGPVSGRRYLFSGPGVHVEVDVRDKAGLLLNPQLRQVTP